MAFIVIKRPFLAVFPKRKRLQWQIFAPAASPSVSRHGASLQVSPESARNQLLMAAPETPFFLLLCFSSNANYSGPILTPGIFLRRRWEDQPDLLNWVGGGKASAGTPVIFQNGEGRVTRGGTG